MGCAQSVRNEVAMYHAAKDGNLDDINRIARKTHSIEARNVMFEWEDNEGRTPMIISIENGHQDATVALLQHGTAINAISKKQGTALLAAMKAENLALVDILLQRGASPFLRNVKGLSAWEYALTNSRSAGLLREFERYGFGSGLLRFQVPATNQSVTGECFTCYSWTRLWVSIIPEYTVHQGQVFVRRLLHVFNHSKSFTAMCIADLEGAQVKIMAHDARGITATLTLPNLPYTLKGIASVGTVESVTLYIRELHQDSKFLLPFLSACDRNWLGCLEQTSLDLEKSCQMSVKSA